MAVPTHPPLFFAYALQGAIADQPSATAVPQDTLYWATDTSTFYISDGSAWNAVTGGGGGSLSVTDGSTTVSSVTSIDFTSGATVSNGGAGVADVAISGGTSSTLLLQGTFQGAFNPTGDGVLNNLSPGISVPSDPVGFTVGYANEVVTLPLFTYTAGAIVTFSDWSVTNVDTTNDKYDIQVQIFVSTTVGASAISLIGTAQAVAGAPGDSANISFADITVSNTVGVDLSYDTGTGAISSAAGGVYGVVAIFSGQWD